MYLETILRNLESHWSSTGWSGSTRETPLPACIEDCKCAVHRLLEKRKSELRKVL